MKTIYLSIVDTHKFKFQCDYADALRNRADAYERRTGQSVTVKAANGETLYVAR